MKTLSFTEVEFAIVSAGLGLYAEYYSGDLPRPQKPSPELDAIDGLISKINVTTLGNVDVLNNLLQKVTDANVSSVPKL